MTWTTWRPCWALLGNPQVMRYYPRAKSREEASAWIAWNQRLYRDHGFGLWLLTLREDGEFVGDCGLTPPTGRWRDQIEVGYHIRIGLQGRGLATDAAAACRDHARDVLGLERLIAINQCRWDGSVTGLRNLAPTPWRSSAGVWHARALPDGVGQRLRGMGQQAGWAWCSSICRTTPPRTCRV